MFLSGLQRDKHCIDEIIKDYGSADPGVEIFLDRPLCDLAFLLKQSAGVLSVDTGILHLARAMNVPVVALFGPSNPDFTGCVGPGEYVQLRNDFPCGPCNYSTEYRYEDKKYCLDGKSPACMKSITPQQVVAALEGILN